MLTFEEAHRLLLNSYWKTEPCGSENCWCLMITPVEPIKYEIDGCVDELYVAGGGALSKDVAEHIVKIHNERLIGKHITPKEMLTNV